MTNSRKLASTVSPEHRTVDGLMTVPKLIIACSLTLPFCSCEKALDAAKKLKPASDPTPPVGQAKMAVPTPPIGPVVVNLEGSAFRSFIRQPGALRVVAFHAEWCGPCKTLAPVLASVAAEYGGWVNVGRLDIDRARNEAIGLGVRSIPDLRLYRDGVEVARFSGVISPAEMRRLFDFHTKELREPVAVTQMQSDGKATTPASPVSPMSKDWLPPGMQRK